MKDTNFVKQCTLAISKRYFGTIIQVFSAKAYIHTKNK